MTDRDWLHQRWQVTGVCWWNHRTLRALARSEAPPAFHPSFDAAFSAARRMRAPVVAWASRLSAAEVARCQAEKLTLVRVEDGFLRSVGLGAGMTPAASLVFDTQGIYFDATGPSTIETLLQEAEIGPMEAERGERLRQQICAGRISKYNLGRRRRRRAYFSSAGSGRVLVPGQVADDASISRTCCDSLDLGGAENVNLQLLRAARRNNPDAHIVFKPHPDVATGLRSGRVDPRLARQFADDVLINADIVDLIDECDKVETLTSLSGFEALLRSKQVAVHGLPFYAGWGLTQDHTRSPRRTRRRSLAELVYLSVVAYGHYVDPRSFAPCEPEHLVAVLQEMRQRRSLRILNAIRQRVAWVGERMNRT